MKAQKLLSAVLAAALVLSAMTAALLPAGALAIGDVITYNNGTEAVFTAGGIEGTDTVYDAGPGPTDLYFGVGSPGANQTLPAWFTYSFTVAEAGVYTVAYNFRWHETSRMQQISIDDTVVGLVDTSCDPNGSTTSGARFVTKNVTDTGSHTGTVAQVELSAGSHTIKFLAVGGGSNETSGNQRFTFAYFTLTCTEVISDYNTPEYTLEVPGIVDGNFTVPISVTDTANNNASCTVDWTSSNTDVISIDEAGNATVAAATPETAVVKLSAEIDTLQGSHNKDFYVQVPATITTDNQYNLLDLYNAGFYTADKCDVVTQSRSNNGVATTHNFIRLDNTESTGASIAFTINVATAGSYKFHYVYRDHGSCGKVRTYINGTAVGDLVDQGDSGSYNTNLASPEIEIELNAGSNTIAFTVEERSGENTSTNGGKANLYDMYLTYINDAEANVIQSVAEVSGITAMEYAAAADLNLPAELEVVLGSGDKATLPVSWTVSDDGVATGTIDLSGTSYTNDKNIAATADITYVPIADAEGVLSYEMRYLKRTVNVDGTLSTYLIGDNTGMGSAAGSDAGHYYWYGKKTGTVSVYIPAGSYVVSYGYKTRSAAGTVQLSIDGVNVGEAVNQMADAQTQMDTGNLGTVTITENGYYDIVLTSTADFTCDIIKLAPVPEADYTAVDAAIDRAEALTAADYTEESWAALQTAIGAVVRDLPLSEQETVDGYAEAIEEAITALVPKAVEMELTISAGMVTTAAASGKYDITWNAQIVLPDGKTAEEINGTGVRFTNYGVYYGTGKEAVEDYQNATADQIRRVVFAEGEDVEIYTAYGFRLKNVTEEKVRAAMFYIEYTLNGQSYILLSTVDEVVAVIPAE